MPDSYLNIHEQKASALRHRKGEAPTVYPITPSDLLEIKKCPLCGSEDFATVAEVYLKEDLVFFRTSTCKKCLFTYRSIHPSLAWFEKCWAQIDEKIYKGEVRVFNPEGESLRERRYEEYLEILSKFPKGTLLDIGAAWGTGANVFKKNGYTVEAIEPEISKRNHLEKGFGIPVVASSIEELLADPGKKYDLLIFVHCLEHLEHPEFVVHHLGQLLKPNGVAYIEIPILERYVNWSDALFLPHKSNFSEENLLDLVHQGGFEVISKHWLYKHSHEIPHDLGLVLRYTGAKKMAITPSPYGLEDIFKAYRKDLSLPTIPEGVLRYNVPVIEHAAQIIIAEGKKMTTKDGFIVFE